MNFIFLNLYSQKTYVNNTTAYYNGKSEFENIANENKTINEITLNTDFTYEMWMRPHLSCFTWTSFKGIWNRKGNNIVFTEKYEVNESNNYQIYKQGSKDKYIILFETDNKILLKNLKVKIDFEYDFESEIKSNEPINLITDTNGKIEIPLDKIPNQDKLASLRFEIDYKGQKIYDYLTENEAVNKKTSEIPTSIKIIIIENPKAELVTRIIKAKVDKDKIKILSINKSKGELPDFNNELKLEKIYTKETL